MIELTSAERSVVDKLRTAFSFLVAIYLHGSGAKGRMHAESDIDIALMAPLREAIVPDEQCAPKIKYRWLCTAWPSSGLSRCDPRALLNPARYLIGKMRRTEYIYCYSCPSHP